MISYLPVLPINASRVPNTVSSLIYPYAPRQRRLKSNGFSTLGPHALQFPFDIYGT